MAAAGTPFATIPSGQGFVFDTIQQGEDSLHDKSFFGTALNVIRFSDPNPFTGVSTLPTPPPPEAPRPGAAAPKPDINQEAAKRRASKRKASTGTVLGTRSRAPGQVFHKTLLGE